MIKRKHVFSRVKEKSLMSKYAVFLSNRLHQSTSVLAEQVWRKLLYSTSQLSKRLKDRWEALKLFLAKHLVASWKVTLKSCPYPDPLGMQFWLSGACGRSASIHCFVSGCFLWRYYQFYLWILWYFNSFITVRQNPHIMPTVIPHKYHRGMVFLWGFVGKLIDSSG